MGEGMGRGGARRTACKTGYDRDELAEEFVQHANDVGFTRAFYLAGYSYIDKNDAVCGNSLLENETFLWRIVQFNSRAEFAYNDVKHAVAHTFHTCIGSNTTGHSDALGAGSKAIELMTMLYHLRRLRDAKRWEQCIGSMDEWSSHRLGQLVNALDGRSPSANSSTTRPAWLPADFVSNASSRNRSPEPRGRLTAANLRVHQQSYEA